MDRGGGEEEGIEYDYFIFSLNNWVYSGVIYGNGEDWGRIVLVGKFYFDYV